MTTRRETAPRRSRRRRAGLLLAAAGALLVAWATADFLLRAGAQRRGLLELEDGAHPPAAAEGDSPAPVEPAPRPGEAVARIVIAAAGVDVVAFEGIDAATLRRGAGHFPGTALPGRRGNASFAAHRDGPFRGLRKLSVGDEIRVETAAASHRYRVSELRVVEPSEVEVVAWRGRSEVTLVTCYPFDYVGPAPRRFVVHAELLAAAPAAAVSGQQRL